MSGHPSEELSDARPQPRFDYPQWSQNYGYELSSSSPCSTSPPQLPSDQVHSRSVSLPPPDVLAHRPTKPGVYSSGDVFIASTLPSPHSYLVWSIASLLCLFFPLGIVALIYSLRVKSEYLAGRFTEAQRKSFVALATNTAATVIGIIIYIAVGTFYGAVLRKPHTAV